jgi:hypothetical protein
MGLITAPSPYAIGVTGILAGQRLVGHYTPHTYIIEPYRANRTLSRRQSDAVTSSEPCVDSPAS